MNTVFKIRLNKGDTVVVMSGKYKGKTGKIVELHPLTNKATVEGINIVKKHTKPNKQYPQGGIIDITMPIWISKLSLFDASNKKPVKIGYKFDKDGKKLRINKTTGKEIK